MATFPIFHNLIGHPIVQWRGLHAAGISEGSVKPLGQTKDHKLCIDYQKTSESGLYFKKVKVWTFEEPLALQVVSRERGFGLLGNQRISRLEENTEPGRLQKTDEAAENKTFSLSTK